MANILAAEVRLNLLGHRGEMWLFSSLILGMRGKELLEEMPNLTCLFLPQEVLDIYTSSKRLQN
jgi:hypothetical protein